ncbi:protein MpBHLH10 [Marchantia polymorpha subsp. ruderalis]|uniref:ACT domain-containing protein n=2 Tax=Marchantia polymorpha TaxID=3197 RepID=A0AAF6B576_MARPO|nr:hypothetical protein MARPO_0098s0046 [Marchantia polymorpha]BBN07160.1 hypothetical protein Mp_4g01540 [Marchantia polymorpha subsp. ruderalis]|eukprot:PTQ32499.1 hypothetical protein MARPO_0098s0046 [Marchantia polymorpha]
MQGRMSREREILQEIVERIGWVYAGLWQPLPPDNSLVGWADGYYNGPVSENSEAPLPSSAQWNQRKERRRMVEELQSVPDSRLTDRPDLSNIEWFYLISSKFEFPFGTDGTPGKMLMTGGYEWICDGEEVNGALFSRTALCKATGMKTVLCLAVSGGVVEIGTTALIDQNLQLVQFVRNMFQRSSGTPKVPISLLSHEQNDDNRDNGLLFNASSATAKFSSPASTNLGMSNPGLPNSSAGRGLGLAPPYQPNFSNPGPLQQINSFGLDTISFAPSLLNGLMREQGPELNLQQAAAAAGSWDLSLEQQLMQDQNMIPANLKHKLTGPTSALTKSGSCVASFEQALFHPHAQHIPQRRALPVESTGKLLSDFQAQLFNQSQLQQQSSLMQNSAETVVSDSPHHSPVPGQPLPDSLKHAHSPDIHWRSVTHSKGIGSPRRLLTVESGKGLAEVSNIDDPSLKCHQLASPSEESHQHNFTDLIPPSNHGHGQQTQYLAELTGEAHTGQSADHSWSSEAISPTISEQEQDPEDGYSLWEDTSETLENGRFLGDSFKHDRSKKARLCGLNMNGHHQSNGTANGMGSFLDHPHMDERTRQENEKFQVLRAMLQPHATCKGDKATVLGDAIEHMRDLQRRVKESESTTTSSASDDGQNPRSLERSSSLTTSLVQGVNHVNLRRDYGHRGIRQQQYGRSGGGDNAPLLKLSDVCLDTNEELDGVVLAVLDDIPQIEVRMMENERVMIKLSSKDRPNLFTDIMFALQDLHLQVQHANIRTVAGMVHDVFAAKVDVALLEKQSTHTIAEAIRRAIERGNSPNSCSPNPATPDANPNVNSPRKRSLQLT